MFRNKLTVDKVKSKESPYGSFRDYAAANPYERVHDDEGKLIESYDTHVATTARYLNPLYEATLNLRMKRLIPHGRITLISIGLSMIISA